MAAEHERVVSSGLHETLARAAVSSLLRSPAIPLLGRLSAPALHRVRLRKLGNATLIDAVDSLLGPMPRPQAEAIAQEIVVNRLRSLSLKALRGVVGDKGTIALARWSDATVVLEHHAQRLPLIVVTWHFGPEVGSGVALERLGIPATVFRTVSNGNPKRDLNIVEYQCVGDPEERGLALKRAFARLRKGGVVSLAIDGRQTGSPIDLPFFGRRIRVGRGAAALARLTGAPVVPVVKLWAADGSVEVRCFQPLERPQVDARDVDAFDLALMTQAVRWFEDFIRSAPGQFRLKNIVRLCAAPRLETTVSR